jgi:hypothetical protein
LKNKYEERTKNIETGNNRKENTNISRFIHTKLNAKIEIEAEIEK